jgi:beta-lactamase superfamily II metal-dependent hydrolase
LSVGGGIGTWTKAGIDGAVIKKIERGECSVSSVNVGETVKLFIRAANGDRIYKTSSREKMHYASIKPKDQIDAPVRLKRQVTIPELEETESDGRGMEILAKVYSKEDA